MVYLRQAIKQVNELTAQLDDVQRWSVEVSALLNHHQLEQAGVGPLRRHFGAVVDPVKSPVKGKGSVKSAVKGPGLSRVKGPSRSRKPTTEVHE
jgi:hypothetical protein